MAIQQCYSTNRSDEGDHLEQFDSALASRKEELQGRRDAETITCTTTDQDEDFSNAQTVIFQVLDSTVLSIELPVDTPPHPGRHLVEFHGIVWLANPHHGQLTEKTELVVGYSRGQKLYLLLDKDFEVSTVYVEKSPYLAFALSTADFQLLEDDSQQLEDLLDIHLLWEKECWLGRTEKLALQNGSMIAKARMATSIYLWLDHAIAVIGPVKSEEELQVFAKDAKTRLAIPRIIPAREARNGLSLRHFMSTY